MKSLEYMATMNNGFKIAVVLISNHHYCGYVGIPSTHPLYCKSYNSLINGKYLDDLFDVHGGITHTAFYKKSPIDDKDNLWWIGFDCAHYGDSIDVKDLKFCVSECESLYYELLTFKE